MAISFFRNKKGRKDSVGNISKQSHNNDERLSRSDIRWVTTTLTIRSVILEIYSSTKAIGREMLARAAVV